MLTKDQYATAKKLEKIALFSLPNPMGASGIGTYRNWAKAVMEMGKALQIPIDETELEALANNCEYAEYVEHWTASH